MTAGREAHANGHVTLRNFAKRGETWRIVTKRFANENKVEEEYFAVFFFAHIVLRLIRGACH